MSNEGSRLLRKIQALAPLLKGTYVVYFFSKAFITLFKVPHRMNQLIA